MQKELAFGLVALVIVGGIYYWLTVNSNSPAMHMSPTPVPVTIIPSQIPVPMPTPTPTPSPTPVLVDIVGYQYSPKTITVKVGTTVTWINRDTVAHTVTASGAMGGPDSALFGQNQSFSYTYNTVGTFDYYCKPHPYMKGSVVVTQ